MDKDFIKEKVGFIKLWTTLLMAIIIGSTAWLVNNWGNIIIEFNAFVITLLIISITITAIINRKAYRLIKEMKNIGETK